MADEELTEFIEAQAEVVRQLERQLLPPPAPKQRNGATKNAPLRHDVSLTRKCYRVISPSRQAASAMHGPSVRSSMRRPGQTWVAKANRDGTSAREGTRDHETSLIWASKSV